MLFSIAMTVSRFAGDGIVARFGNRIVLTLGGVIAVLGLCGLILAPVPSDHTPDHTPETPCPISRVPDICRAS